MDETGKFFRAEPTKSLSDAGKRCTAGKQSKGRLKCAFFINVGGGKEKAIVIKSQENLVQGH